MDPVFEAFIGPAFDQVFQHAAAFDAAAELESFDIPEVNAEAREAVELAVRNAVAQRACEQRIALLTGDGGAGKTHAVATGLRRLAREGSAFPVVVQMTASVADKDFELWLLRVVARELSGVALMGNGASPLSRLVERLLSMIPPEQSAAYRNAIDEGDDSLVKKAELLVKPLRRVAQQKAGGYISDRCLFALLLAHGGVGAGEDYLHGRAGRLERTSIRLERAVRPTDRIGILEDLAGAIRATGGALVVVFDQFETMLKIGDESSIERTFNQGVALAQTTPNLAVVFAVLDQVYSRVREHLQVRTVLDRVERGNPSRVRLTAPERSAAWAIVVRRMQALKRSEGLDPNLGGESAPIPDWWFELFESPNIRGTIEELSQLRNEMKRLRRVPTREEYLATRTAAEPIEKPADESEADFGKLWQDAQDDIIPVQIPKRVQDQAALLGWILPLAAEENHELMGGEATRSILPGNHETEILDLTLLTKTDIVAERRRIALCDAPVVRFQLRDQISEVLHDTSFARTVVIRTPNFPKAGENAVALAEARESGGIVVDFAKSDWERMERFKRFAEIRAATSGFDRWRRSARPLSSIPSVKPLVDLIPTEGKRSADQMAAGMADEAREHDASNRIRAWLGYAHDRSKVYWDPSHPELPLANFGVLVTGDSGRGKTQTISILIDAAARAELPTFIFDFKNDYAASEFAQRFALDVVRVRTEGLPFNPLLPVAEADGRAQPVAHAYEIAGLFRRIFRLGEQQQAEFRKALETAYRDMGIDPQAYLPAAEIPGPSLGSIIQILETQGRQDALLNRIRPLHDLGIVRDGAGAKRSFTEIASRRVVFALNDLPDDELKAAIAELTIIQLHAHMLRGEQPRRLTRLVIFDEAWRVKESKRLGGLAREGRAFGIGIVVGVQFPGDLPDTLTGSLDTKILLANAEASHQASIQRTLLGTTTGPKAQDLRSKLIQLKSFEGFIRNSQNSPFVPVSIEPLFRRDNDI